MITLEHTIEEINLLLKHLGNGVYSEVGALIAKIHGQALPQIQKTSNKTEKEETSEEVKE